MIIFAAKIFFNIKRMAFYKRGAPLYIHMSNNGASSKYDYSGCENGVATALKSITAMQ